MENLQKFHILRTAQTSEACEGQQQPASSPVRQGRLPAQADCPQDPRADPLLGHHAQSALKRQQNSDYGLCQDWVILLCLYQRQLQDLVPPQKQLRFFLHGTGGWRGWKPEKSERSRFLPAPWSWMLTAEDEIQETIRTMTAEAQLIMQIKQDC